MQNFKLATCFFILINIHIFQGRKEIEYYWDFKTISCSFDSEYAAPNYSCSIKRASRSSIGTFNVDFVLLKDINEFFVSCL